jgi:hypothetical protein
MIVNDCVRDPMLAQHLLVEFVRVVGSYPGGDHSTISAT